MSIWVPLVIIYMNWCVGALRTLGQHFSLKTLETTSLDDPEAAKVLQAEPTEIGRCCRVFGTLESPRRELGFNRNHSCCNWNIFCCGLVSKRYLIDDTIQVIGKYQEHTLMPIPLRMTDDLRKECKHSEDCTLEKDEIKNKLKENR